MSIYSYVSKDDIQGTDCEKHAYETRIVSYADILGWSKTTKKPNLDVFIT